MLNSICNNDICGHKADYFGAKTGHEDMPDELRLDRITHQNYFPVTAMIRKDFFYKSGEFDETMRDGYEDWEFWIRCYSRGAKIIKIDDILLDYRKYNDGSSINDGAAKKDKELRAYIYSRHKDLFDLQNKDRKKRIKAKKRRNIILIIFSLILLITLIIYYFFR